MAMKGSAPPLRLLQRSFPRLCTPFAGFPVKVFYPQPLPSFCCCGFSSFRKFQTSTRRRRKKKKTKTTTTTTTTTKNIEAEQEQ
jgi:hypothetical protein